MPSERRLAAIMFTDIVGYTALMAESEERGLMARRRHRELVRTIVVHFHGEAIEARGDESLSILPSSLDAVECAIAIEKAAEDEGLALHLGVHLGDVVIEGGEVSGDGVNLASRICSLSSGGGICVSSEVRQAIRSQPDLRFDRLGEPRLKNVGRSVEVWRLARADSPRRRVRKSFLRLDRIAVAGLTLLALGFAVLALYRLAPLEGSNRVSGPNRPWIVVLPFDNASEDPEQDYLARGVTEELVLALSRGPLPVIDLNTTLNLDRQRPFNMRATAVELGARYAISGTVLRSSRAADLLPPEMALGRVLRKGKRFSATDFSD